MGKKSLPIKDTSYISAKFLIYAYCFILGAYNIAWLMNIDTDIRQYQERVPIILLILLVVLVKTHFFYKLKTCAIKYISAAVVVLVGAFFTNKYSDLSSDFISSHSVMIAALQLGWNPLTDPDGISIAKQYPWFSGGNFSFRADTGLASQILQNFNNSLTGISNSYFIVNVFFLVLGAIFVRTTILELCALTLIKLKSSQHFLLVCKFIYLSPALISQQLFTGYNDIVTYCISVSIFCILLVCTINPRLWTELRFPLFLLIITLPSFKLNFFVLSAIAVLPSIYLSIANRSTKRRLLIESALGTNFFLGLTLLIFPFFWGAQRWVQGNPPWFLSDNKFEDAWLGGQPRFYLDWNGLERVWSVFAGRTSLNPEFPDLSGLFAFPSNQEFRFAGFLDNRMGGLGPLGGDVAFISFTLAIVVFFLFCFNFFRGIVMDTRMKACMLILFLLVSLIFLLFASPMSFMIRYFPHYSLITLLMYFILIIVPEKEFGSVVKKIKYTFFVSLSLLLLNVVITQVSMSRILLENNRNISNFQNAVRASELIGNDNGFLKITVNNKIGFSKRFGENLLRDPSRFLQLECPAKDIILSYDDEIALCKIS